MYALGFVSDPITYAIETLERISVLIGQDKQVDFAIMALRELRDGRPTPRALDLAITCEKCGDLAKYPVCKCGTPIPRPPNQ